MSITLGKLVFDGTNPAEAANVGAYLRAADGTLITHTGAALDVNIASSSGLGIYAEDDAHASGDLGQQVLAVRQDTPGSLVGADGDYAPLQVDANGNLRVAGSFAPADNHAEDDAHVSGDIGSFVLSVREDTLAASTGASGDYQALKTDALGRLRNSSAKQSGVYAAVSVGATATDLVATDLANRTSIIVQNAGLRDCYIGLNSSVTTANGLLLTRGASIELEASAALNLHAITAAGTTDVRVMELV
jgi:hypothetical protein